MKDPWGRQIYWIGGGEISWTGEPDSDFRAIEDGYVSVTPLQLDLTHHDVLQGAEHLVARPVEANSAARESGSSRRFSRREFAISPCCARSR